MVRARAQVVGPTREIAVGRSRSEAAGGVGDWWCRHEGGALGRGARAHAGMRCKAVGTGEMHLQCGGWMRCECMWEGGARAEHGAWGWVVMRKGGRG